MGISKTEAMAVVDEFRQEYPAISAIAVRVEDTQEELYGPQATKEAVGIITGAFTPGTRDQWGHVSRGRCDLALAGIHSREELRRTLRHELVGHFGLNTFTVEEKRSVLTAIVGARSQEGIAPLWEEVDKQYSFLSSRYSREEAELRKAEEIYAMACERIPPNHRADISIGQRSFRDTCIDPIRPMQAADIARIAEMVSQGLRDGSRVQQIFPREPDAQFSLDKEPTMTTQEDRESDALRTRLRGEPGVTPEDTRSELLEDLQKVALRSRLRDDPAMSPEDTRSELLDEASRSPKLDEALKAQREEDERKRAARARAAAGKGLNVVDNHSTDKGLDAGDFIIPRRITNTYNALDGKFYAKDSQRVVFEDQGHKLATSSSDKQTVADMILYARAKQWDSLKLGGSPEFRREGWLEAESQGLRTEGYTPKHSDLAALEALRQERATNLITPLRERTAEPVARTADTPVTPAPRHDLNKNQAGLHAEATRAIGEHMATLQKIPALAERSDQELERLAYLRGLVAEQNKAEPAPIKDEALARFDKYAEDPQFIQRVERETLVSMTEKTTERVPAREVEEQSL